jgi:uncharacterized protein YkwD
MRKILQATLPLLTIIVIGASFFLLTKQHHDSEKVLGASRVAASTVQKPLVTTAKIKKRAITIAAISAKQTPTPVKLRLTPTPTPLKPQPSDQATLKLDSIKPTSLSTDRPTPTPTKSEPTMTKSEPTPTSLPVSSGDTIQNYIMQKINDYRSSQGLDSVSIDSNTCSFARTRAGEIVQNFNHDGFSGRISSHTLPYSSYREVTENIAMTSDYTQVVTLWINSSGHAENMRKDTPFVCVEKSGNYYAYEGWKP